MLRNSPSVAYQLFSAINENDLHKLQSLLGEDPALLLLTDLSAPQLEQELVGSDDLPVGKFPRMGQGNTLLNFALLLDRVEIASELVWRHIQHKQQEIFYQVNNENSFPLHMVYNLQCEYSVMYQQRQLVVTKIYTVEEKALREQQAIQLASNLLISMHGHLDKAHAQLKLVLITPPGVVVIPEIAINYLRVWLQFGGNDPQHADLETLAAIGNYLILLQLKSFNIEASTQEVEALIKKIQDDPEWTSAHGKQEAIEQVRAQLKLAVDIDFLSIDRIKNIMTYIKLMQGDRVLNALLTKTLSKPYIDFNNPNILNNVSLQPEEEVKSDEEGEVRLDAEVDSEVDSEVGAKVRLDVLVQSDDEFDPESYPPLIFQLVYASCQENFEEEYKGVHVDYTAALILLSPPVLHLKNSLEIKLSEYLDGFSEVEEDILLINSAEQDFLSRVEKVITEYEELNPHKKESATRAPVLKAQLEKVAAAALANDLLNFKTEFLNLQTLAKKFMTAETYGWGHFIGKHAGGLDSLLQKHLSPAGASAAPVAEVNRAAPR